MTAKGNGILVGTAATALVVVVAFPIAFIILQAIFPKLGQGSLIEPFSRTWAVFTDPDLAILTANTVLLGIAVVLPTALVGVPLGLLRELAEVPLAPLWDIVLLVPFMIPPYIATLGWILTLQPRGYLEQLAGFNLSSFLFSFWGVAFVMALHSFPVVYFAVSRTVAAIGSRFADVGRVSGASPWIALRRITLPLAMLGLAGSLLLVFAMTIEEYGTPAALGHRSGFYVLVTGIDSRVSDWPIDLPGAATLSLLLMAIAMTAFYLQNRLIAQRSFQTVGGKPMVVARRALGVWAVPVVVLFALGAVLATGVPLFGIFATALSKTLSGGLVGDNLGFQNFALVLDNRAGALRALENSLSLGVGTALVTGLLGTLVAYIVLRTRLRGRNFLDGLTVLPNAVPGIVVAVGLILAWNQPFWPVSPYNTPLILLLAYSCILLPYPVRYANAAFRQIGESLEAVARVSGASAVTVFRRILLPLVAPSLLAAMLLVFSVASRELVASILVSPVGMPTIAGFIWRQFEQGSVGLGMAMSAVAILITTTIPLMVALLTRRTAGLD